ncbi:MAG: hypothetical protein KF753_10455 [Caldilineaceae bacterium]|nr:hypothetical protein [Caldilineaceae bacterium]
MRKIRHQRGLRRWVVVLICTLILSGLPSVGYAQEVTVKSDEWLFESGLNAYNTKDFFTAALYFQAYIQRNPQRMRNDTTHASEVRAALDYSAKAVRAAMRCRSLALDNCGVNSQGLLVSKGFGLHSSTPPVIQPPPVRGSSGSSAPSTTTTTSSAETPYAVVCLVNKTNRDINYSYRWGDNEWKSQSVSANSSRYHSWTYAAGSHSSPDFRVRYDADFTSGTDYKQYVLKRYRNSKKSCNGAKKYEFKDAGGSVVGLYGVGD